MIPITLPGSPVQGVGGTRVAPELKRLLSREGLGGENGFPNYFLSSHQERLIIFLIINHALILGKAPRVPQSSAIKGGTPSPWFIG